MPIVFVSSGARLGGEERYLALLLDGLGEGWVERIVVLEHGPFADRLRDRGFSVEVLPTSRRAAGMLLSAIRLRRRLGRGGSRLVHANGLKAALVSTLATLGTSLPVLWAKHDFSWDGVLARAIGARCRQIVGVSEAVTRTFRGKTRARVHIVHNGLEQPPVDRRAARAGLLAALGSPEDGPVVVLVGRIVPSKGHRELVALAPELLSESPGLRIVFLGAEQPSHASYATQLRREIGAAGLDDVITFLGHRDDAPSLVAGCDLLVAPSGPDERGMDTEGFPYAALEAMAVGTPVAGYAHGGLPELLGPCGVLVAGGDRPALRDAILMLLSDEGLRREKADCGRERAAARFTLETMLEQMEERYRATAKVSS